MERVREKGGNNVRNKGEKNNNLKGSREDVSVGVVERKEVVGVVERKEWVSVDEVGRDLGRKAEIVV